MTKELIEARKALLIKEREELRANFAAYNGAIQECDYWLSQIDKQDEPKPELKVVPNEEKDAEA